MADVMANEKLRDAVYFGNANRVRELLYRDADPNAMNDEGFTSLFYASDYPNIIEILLDNNANPNFRSILGETPLMLASYYGNIDSVQLLLDKGANPNLRDSYDQSAYDDAISGGHLEVANLLRRHMMATILQKRSRGNMTRRRNPINIARTSRARQKLHTSRLPIADDLTEMIDKQLSHMSFNPKNIVDETPYNMLSQGQTALMADYLDTLNQYGSGKRKRKNYTRKRKKKKRKQKKEKKKKKLIK